jgi:hypothetical protein
MAGRTLRRLRLLLFQDTHFSHSAVLNVHEQLMQISCIYFLTASILDPYLKFDQPYYCGLINNEELFTLLIQLPQKRTMQICCEIYSL